MLFDWAIGVSILLSIILAAFVASFLLDNIFTFKSNRKPTDDSIQEALHNASVERRLIQKKVNQQIAFVYLNQIFNSILEIFSKIFELPSILTYAITVLWQNRTVIIVTAIISSIAFATFENGPLVLEKLDGFYSCVVTPFVNNILFSILHIINLFWAAFVPIFNIFVILTRQLYTGTVFITTKCATSSFSLLQLQKDFVNFFIQIFEEVLNFTGINDNNFSESNMIYNPFNVYPIAEKFRRIFYFIPQTFSCLCKATSDWSNTVFYGSIISDRMDWVSHHAFNFLLSFVQTFFKIIPPFLEYPSFEKTFFHWSAGIWELCKLFDEWIFEIIKTILNTTNVDGGILIQTPNIFAFEAFSHLVSAPLMMAETAVDAITHVVLPFDTTPITNTKYMASLFKMDEAFTHLSLFSHSVAHIISWILKVLMELLVSIIYKNYCIEWDQSLGITNTTCARYMNGKCSVSCVNRNTIQINDVGFQCLFQSNAKNKYKGQQSVFDAIKNEVASQLMVTTTTFYSTNKYLPVEDKVIYFEFNKIEKIISFKTYYEDVNIREQAIFDKCPSLNPNLERRKICYEELIEHELQTAYGMKGGAELNNVIACTIESIFLIPIKSLQILYNFVIDYFWFNFIGYFQGDQIGDTAFQTKRQKNRENFRGLIRAFSGPWFSRDSPPPSYTPYNLTVDGNHFYNELDYKNFLKSNDDTYGQVNLNEHVLYHFDRFGYYITSLLEKETFGKILFNVWRLAVEQVRIIVRLEAEGYGFSNERRTIFVNGSTVSPDGDTDIFQDYPSLFQTEIGCLYNYGNTSNIERGFCSDQNTIENVTQCNVYDQKLNFTTECACIEDPGFHTGDYNLMEIENVHYYSTKAISKWCSINFWEFNYVFLARVFNGIRNFLTALSIDNLKQGFPPLENVCDTTDYQYTQTSTVSSVFNQDCQILAYKDFMCPAGELLQRVYLTLARFLRKEQRNFLILFSGIGLQKMNLKLADNVCDAQNALMALSNMVSSLLLSQDINLQKPVTKVFFSMINIVSIPLEFGVLGLRGLRAFITGDPSIIDTGNAAGFNQISVESLRGTIMQLLTKFINIITRHMVEVFTAFSEFLDTLEQCNASYQQCASSIFNVFITIVEILESLANDIILPTLLDLVELLVRVIQFLVDPSSVTANALETLIEKMFDVIKSVFEALVSNASVWLSFLMDTLLGPVGDIITAVQSAVCAVLSFANGIGAELNDDFCNARRRLHEPRFRRKLLSNTSVLFEVANNFNWDDNSRCDKIMLAYQDYEVSKMSPLEKIEWAECLHLRFLAEILEDNFVIGMPKDIFYNWLRKYTVAYDVLSSSLIYVIWYFSKNPTLSNLKIQLENNGYNPKYTLNIIKHFKDMYDQVFSWQHFKTSMEALLNTENDSRGSRVYKNIRKLHTHATKTKWTASMINAKKAFHKFYNKIEIDKDIFNNDVNFFSQNVRDLMELRSKMDSSIFGAAYGAFTNLQCPADSILCLDCALLDNFLYNGILQIRDAGTFYKEDFKNVIVPEFEAYWENVSSYNARYTKAYERANVNRATYGGTLEVTLPFGTFVFGLFEGDNDIQDFINGLSYFLQGNYTGQIPSDAKIMFPNDLQYYIEKPFQVGCDEADWKWKSYKENVGDGFFSVFILFLILEIFRLFIGEFNVLITLSLYSGAILVSQNLFLYNTYGYNPLCWPIMPAYLWHDILWWSDINVWLDCACSYVPYLSIEPCVEQTCDTCEISSTFYECRDLLPAFQELGYAYHFVFLFRWLLPNQFAYIGNLNTWPFTYIFSNGAFQKLRSDTERNLDITGVEYNCFYLHILTPISILIISYIILLMTIPLLNIVIKTVKESISIFINIILVLYYLSQASGFSEAN